MIPLCEECEAEPADLVIPKAQGIGDVHLCDACFQWLFEFVLATPDKEETIQ